MATQGKGGKRGMGGGGEGVDVPKIIWMSNSKTKAENNT